MKLDVISIKDQLVINSIIEELVNKRVQNSPTEFNWSWFKNRKEMLNLAI